MPTQKASLRPLLAPAAQHEAKFQEASLDGANLDGANLQAADVTKEQLASTQSLEIVIMPDGQKSEDWLNWDKDQEGRGKDVANE